MSYKVTAFDLKLALLDYFRFERQWVCVDEFCKADIVADTGKDIIEVEVKVGKGDLENNEAYKTKHFAYRMGRQYRQLHPNRFYFCVPESLVTSAIGVCENLNPKYGVVAFNVAVFERHLRWKYKQPHRGCLRMARTAKRLHDGYASCQKAIAMRTSSKIITLLEHEFKRNLLERNKDDKTNN